MPVFIPAGTDDVFGIFTRPASTAANGIAVLVLPGGGGEPTFGKNQVRRRLARELAGRGFHVLRINYRGVAESGGKPRKVDFEDPWTEDGIASIHWLESEGFKRIVIVGQCFGGRTALAMAEQVPELVGLALVAPPVRDVNHQEAMLRHPLSWYLRRGARLRSTGRLVGNNAAKRRRKTIMGKLRRTVTASPKRQNNGASSGFLDGLKATLDAGTPILFLYGSSADFYPDFDFVQAGPMARMVERSGDLITMQVVDARFGGMQSLPTQDVFVNSLIAWIGALVPTAATVTAGRS
jgi:dienelactone hydrolase